MKHMESIDEIVNKIEKMREFCRANDTMQEFFKVNDEVMPFIDGLFIFLRDIMPLMTDLNITLRDGNRKLPTASQKISSASNTSEMATHEIMDKLDNISKVLPEVQNGGEEKVIDIQNDVNDILLALQFQDITSQQLEHADRILTAIHEKFSQLFSSIDKIKMSTGLESKIFHVIESSGNDKHKKKEAEVFNEKTEDKMRYDKEISQDDIDALFG